MQRSAHIVEFEHAAKPVNVVRGLQKRVLAVNGGVSSLHEIVDLADRFLGDITDALDTLRHEQEMVGIDVPILDKAPRLLRAATRLVRKSWR